MESALDRYLINKDFHMIIARSAGNRLVSRILDDACEKLVLERRIENVTHWGGTIHRQHSEILKAIKRKELKQVQEGMAVNLESIKSTLLRQIDMTTRAVRPR
jgi:DNA-binding GntR family transcriptional regulator